MKAIKGLFILAALAMILAPPALALESSMLYIYQVNPAGVTVYGPSPSGVTTSTDATLSDSGVSLMERRYGKQTDQNQGDIWSIDISKSNGLFEFKISDLELSYAVSEDYNNSGLTDFSSGTTNGFFVKVAEENTAAAFAAADYIPIWTNQAVNSSVSAWAKRLQMPIGNFMRGYWLPSGITAYGLAAVQVTTGFDDNLKDQFSPVITQVLTFNMNANSGTSTTASDDSGADLAHASKWGVAQIIGPSGTSAYFTQDKTAVTAGAANILQNAEPETFNRQQLENLRLAATTPTAVRIVCYGAKP